MQPELLDLGNILSVQRASKRLRHKYERIDAAILNAGIGGWTGVDWVKATKQFFRDGVYMLTKPDFKIGEVGRKAASQLPKEKDAADAREGNGVGDAREEPELGAVFTANLFGHYLLAHYLMPLLSRSADEEASRIIWVGTLERSACALALSGNTTPCATVRAPLCCVGGQRINTCSVAPTLQLHSGSCCSPLSVGWNPHLPPTLVRSSARHTVALASLFGD